MSALDKLQLQLAEQRNVAKLLGYVFETFGDVAAAGNPRTLPDDVWEGLVVVCRGVDRSLEAISADAEDLVRDAAQRLGGGAR
jgi:hypothetical protein